MRMSISFKIIDAGATDMSLGSPGSINTVEEQVQHLVGGPGQDTPDCMLTGRMKDEYRVYIPAWGFDGSNYLVLLLEELSVSQGEPMIVEGTARFVLGGNPLA